MKIPSADRKRALFIVDIQQEFIKPEGKFVLENIKKLLSSVPYDLYVESIFFCEKGSIWSRQTNEEMMPRGTSQTLPEISELLSGKKVIKIEKHTKSLFKGDKDLTSLLHENGIEEINIIGYDTDDCILSTAEESFDLGFLTYVIEECTASSSGEEMRQKGIDVLRNTCLTNNSCVEKINFREI